MACFYKWVNKSYEKSCCGNLPLPCEKYFSIVLQKFAESVNMGCQVFDL